MWEASGALQNTTSFAQPRGIPIVNKRISVTPIALVGAAACRTPQDFVGTVSAKAWGMERISISSAGVIPLLTNAE